MNSLTSWARLVRLPNLPTAIADIALAGLATNALTTHPLPLAGLLLCSCCLYLSGMIWNDYFDYEQDYRERPERPLPAGQISRRSAALGATFLMLVGLGFAVLAGWRAATLAGLLIVAIFAYDSWLKHTLLGPVAMGSCRFLNVLLGISATESLHWPMGPHLALVVGWYIVGVTWFARTEARESNRRALTFAAGIMLSALLLGVAVPIHLPEEGLTSPLFVPMLVTLGFWLGLPVYRAIQQPTPSLVQQGVKRALMGLILLDTALATGVAGSLGLTLLLLLVPSLYLNRKRWLYAT